MDLLLEAGPMQDPLHYISPRRFFFIVQGKEGLHLVSRPSNLLKIIPGLDDRFFKWACKGSLFQVRLVLRDRTAMVAPSVNVFQFDKVHPGNIKRSFAFSGTPHAARKTR